MKTSLNTSIVGARKRRIETVARDDRRTGLRAPFADDNLVTSPRTKNVPYLQRGNEDHVAAAARAVLQLASVIEQQDPDIEEHCRRVTGYATAFGLHLNLSNEDIVALERAAILHDLGLAAVPDTILHKCGGLTDEEWSAVRRHPILTAQLCEEIPSLARALPALRSHHEKLNGRGYPDGLSGDDVPYLAQVLGIVDAYDALTTSRPYRKALSDEEAILELRGDVQREWRRADLVEAFATLLSGDDLRQHQRDVAGDTYGAYVKAAIT